LKPAVTGKRVLRLTPSFLFILKKIFVLSVLIALFGAGRQVILETIKEPVPPFWQKVCLAGILLCPLIIDHLRMPKIPAVKPLLIVPQSKDIQFRSILRIFLRDFMKHCRNILLLAFVSVIVPDPKTWFSILLLYVGALASGWQFGVHWRFRTRPPSFSISSYLFLFYFFISVFIIFNLIPSLFILITTALLSILTYLSLFKNVESYLLSVYGQSRTIVTNISTHQLHRSLPPIYVRKEFRMGIRSRRLRHIYFLGAPFYLFVMIILLFLPKAQPRDLKLYFLFIASTAGVFNEYFEKFWRWDEPNLGLISSVPRGQHEYFIQRCVYAFAVGGFIPIIHIIFFHNDFVIMAAALLAGMSLMIGLPAFAGYNSVTDQNQQTDLNASIWSMKQNPMTLRFGVSLLFLLVYNWFVLLNPLKSGASLGLYSLVVGFLGLWALITSLLVKSYHRFQFLEWKV